jgi:hypothetical protein
MTKLTVSRPGNISSNIQLKLSMHGYVKIPSRRRTRVFPGQMVNPLQTLMSNFVLYDWHGNPSLTFSATANQTITPSLINMSNTFKLFLLIFPH